MLACEHRGCTNLSAQLHEQLGDSTRWVCCEHFLGTCNEDCPTSEARAGQHLT